MKIITDIDWNNNNISRASFLPYYIDCKNEIWLIFGVNSISGNITDFGGSIEPGDKNFIHTAIREYKEECNELFGPIILKFDMKVITSYLSYHILFRTIDNPKHYLNISKGGNILSKELNKLVVINIKDINSMLHKRSKNYNFSYPLKLALENNINEINIKNLTDIANISKNRIIIKKEDDVKKLKIKILKNKISKSIYDPDENIISENTIKVKYTEINDIDNEMNGVEYKIIIQPDLDEINIKCQREWGIYCYYAIRDNILVFCNKYMNIYVIKNDIDKYINYLSNFPLQRYSLNGINKLRVKRDIVEMVKQYYPNPMKIWNMIENIKNIDNTIDSLIEEIKLISTLENNISKYQISNNISMYNITDKLNYYDILNDKVINYF